mmetsp:Transcript_6698/g.23286  ORF Transcript_6698/g.23286 Transcript_6698/m.23286 type:complete len:231 (+) Transcript_6698:3468-4160(+)
MARCHRGERDVGRPYHAGCAWDVEAALVQVRGRGIVLQGEEDAVARVVLEPIDCQVASPKRCAFRLLQEFPQWVRRRCVGNDDHTGSDNIAGVAAGKHTGLDVAAKDIPQVVELAHVNAAVCDHPIHLARLVGREPDVHAETIAVLRVARGLHIEGGGGFVEGLLVEVRGPPVAIAGDRQLPTDAVGVDVACIHPHAVLRRVLEVAQSRDNGFHIANRRPQRNLDEARNI